LELAQEYNLETIAITDHDTVDAAIKIPVLSNGLKVIPGIEFSADFPSQYHMLGYFPSTDIPNTIEAAEKLKNAREDRMRTMVEQLQKKGYHIDYTDITKYASGSIGKPHVAQALVEKGYATDVEAAFSTILSKAEDTKRFKYKPKELIDIIHKDNGIAIIAHPNSLNFTHAEFNVFFLEQLKSGIDGLEVFYPSHSIDDIHFYKALTDDYNLSATAGSDFHGFKADSDIAEPSLLKPYSVWQGFKII